MVLVSGKAEFFKFGGHEQMLQGFVVYPGVDSDTLEIFKATQSLGEGVLEFRIVLTMAIDPDSRQAWTA